MSKGLAITALVIAIFIFLFFGLDLVSSYPFGCPSIVLDIGFVISSGILAYMSWTTYRAQR